MNTLISILERANVSVPDETIAELEVPVLTGPQRQGDVLVIPRPPIGDAEHSAMNEVPADGVAVITGEATGNTHMLQPEPGTVIRWAPAPTSGTSVNLGVLEVEPGATAWLIHTDEHGANGIGAGCYTIHGKREMVEEIRRVAD